MSQKKGDDKEPNIFILNDLYPEADSVFSFKPQSLEEIKNTCLVVLDTNVLLVPFVTGKESLQQIKATYQHLVKAERLVVPGRVAREFAKNRAEKLKTIYQQVSRKQNLSISKSAYPLLESSEEYQKLIQIEKELDSKLSEYRQQLSTLLDEIQGWYWDDPVSSLYRELFSSQVVVDITHDENKLRLDLENRQLHKIPPGFQDSAKEDKGIGDLLVWLTILELGQDRKQDIIFVTGDSKNDWRYQSENHALYPRFELVEEYRRHSDGKTIHIINFSKFLQLFGASPEVVDEVRQEEAWGDTQESKRTGERRILPLARRVRDVSAVKEWIMASFQSSEIHRVYGVENFLDFLIRDSNSMAVGVKVKSLSTSRSVPLAIRDFTSHARNILEQMTMDKLFLVLVLEEIGIESLDFVPQFTNLLPPKMSVFVGTVSPGDNFFIPKLHVESTQDIEEDEDQLPF